MIWIQCESADCNVNVAGLKSLKVVHANGQFELRAYFLEPAHGDEYEVLMATPTRMEAHRALARVTLLIVNNVQGVHPLVQLGMKNDKLEREVIDGLRAIDRPIVLGSTTI